MIDSTRLLTQAERTVQTVHERLAELDTLDIETGPWDGTKVFRIDDVYRSVAGAIPESSRHGVDVRTPGRIVATAVCPRCGQSGLITLEVSTILQVDSKGAELRLKGSSKAASHVCGQTAIGDLDGQLGAFDISDIVGEEHGSQPLHDLLRSVGFDVPLDVIAEWTLEQQETIATWAAAASFAAAQDGEDITVPAIPPELDGYADASEDKPEGFGE